MAWDDDRFDRFVDASIRMARGQLPGYGYRQVILPYEPGLELTCIDELQKLPGRLQQAGLTAKLVPLAPFVAEAVSRFARRPLSDAREYGRLESDLSSPRQGLLGKTLDLLEPQIRAADPETTIVVLCRLGALYPFCHVSALLDGLHARSGQTTLSVVYPGSADGTHLRFLGLLDPTGGYRGHIVT
ncbi:MAG: BREX protein BrxB domain-containing protein [Thermoanaerobaculia bacterium]